MGCVSKEMRVVKGSMHCWALGTSGLSVFFLQLCLMFPFAAAVMYWRVQGFLGCKNIALFLGESFWPVLCPNLSQITGAPWLWKQCCFTQSIAWSWWVFNASTEVLSVCAERHSCVCRNMMLPWMWAEREMSPNVSESVPLIVCSLIRVISTC